MKVRELLSGPEKWTKGTLARTIEGDPCNANEFAACFCLYGAVCRCYDNLDEMYYVVDRIHQKAGIAESIGEWNDAPGRTFEDIKALVEELDI